MVLTYTGERMPAGHQQVVAFYRRTVDADEIDIALSEEGIAVDPRAFTRSVGSRSFCRDQRSHIQRTAEQAYRTGGKKGLHTEHLGPMLAEMQLLFERVLPGQQW